jgi:hypothetical protein
MLPLVVFWLLFIKKKHFVLKCSMQPDNSNMHSKCSANLHIKKQQPNESSIENFFFNEVKLKKEKVHRKFMWAVNQV